MYVPEELKVNKFVVTRIPSPSQYFARFGSFTPASAYYTGDEVHRDLNKVDSINDYLDYARSEMAKHQSEDDA